MSKVKVEVLVPQVVRQKLCNIYAQYYIIKLNQYNPTLSLSQRANTDILPYTSTNAVLLYIAKYYTKDKTSTSTYRDIATSLLPYINKGQPTFSFATKVINRLIADRDQSVQEVSYILFQVPLYLGSREVIRLDYRTKKDLREVLNLDEDEDSPISSKSLL